MLMTVTDVLISVEEAEENRGFSGLKKKNPCAAQTLAEDVSFLLRRCQSLHLRRLVSV